MASEPAGDVAGRIGAAIDAEAARDALSGVIRISRGGALLFERAFGQASVQLGVANTPATRFHIASVTKMFIAAAVLRLVAERRLRLDAHPSVWLPAAAALDPRITLHQLLTHTAGLADIYGIPGLRTEMARLAESGERLLDYLVALPPASEPGARWSYSSTGYLLLAEVAAAAAGTSFEALLGEMFLEPLGLVDTGPDDPMRVNPGRALGHARRDGEWRHAPADALAGVGGPREFYSTAADLDRWASALLEGRVLDAASLALTFARHAHVGPGSGFDPSLDYGYGWFLGPDYRWIGGMTGGFRAALWQFPTERLNVVMLWNSEAVNSARLFARLRPLLLE